MKDKEGNASFVDLREVASFAAAADALTVTFMFKGNATSLVLNMSAANFQKNSEAIMAALAAIHGEARQ